MCGLKLPDAGKCIRVKSVTPFVGVWIETGTGKSVASVLKVTPFVGVWIETTTRLKRAQILGVTPFVGVWIETKSSMEVTKVLKCHTLRGCVD